MIITTRSPGTKELTFQFTDEEWNTLLWINANRTEAWFLEWLGVKFATMSQRKMSDLKYELVRKWHEADQSTQDQVKTLLGVT